MTIRQVSRPIKSASFSGPMGTLVPRIMDLSMSSLVASPSYKANMASLMYGMSNRLTMNPGISAETVLVFPIRSASSLVVAKVEAEVCFPLMSSTSFITGTGFIKCIPTKFDGFLNPAASFVIEMEDVFEATMALSFWRIPFRFWKIWVLRDSTSGTASMTKSQSFKSSSVEVVRSLWSDSFLSPSEIFPFPTSLLRVDSIPDYQDVCMYMVVNIPINANRCSSWCCWTSNRRTDGILAMEAAT